MQIRRGEITERGDWLSGMFLPLTTSGPLSEDAVVTKCWRKLNVHIIK